MAVFRVERTGDYTVMSNFHLKDKRLSLKAKGLLSQMLSLPDDWDYTLSGLSYINRESKDAIRSAVNELETAGYIRRRQTTDASGKFAANEYTIFERPIEGEPMLDKPLSENPITVNPSAVNPLPENPTQLNTKKSNTQKQNTHGSNTDSIPFRETAAVIPPERKGRDAMSVTEIENYRELILENIEYDCLKQRYPLYLDDLNEIVELLVETVCAKRKTTRISGADFPHEIVRSRFLKLDSSHIEFVMDCLQKNTTQVHNIKQYLLAVLFNAPTTMNNHYTSLVNHDMQLNFRVSAEELAVIEQKMSQFGTSNREAYLRKMALDGYVVKLELPELKELVSLMRRSSNNLNQLTRKVHETGRVYDADLEDISQRQEQLWEGVEEILTQLSKLL